MSSIDERVVQMRFDNAAFEKGAKTTMDTLGRLDSDLNKMGQGNSLHGLGGILGTLSGKFAALGAVGVTALVNITNKAVDAGLALGNALTLEPISDGFAEYETKIGSIQTMLANTQKYGTTLGEVTDVLEELNAYSDKTIYNFGDMTKNIGFFTNAGLKVEDASAMIQGFSNVAAASGTTSMGAAAAAYQLSQAMSNGVVTLQDWRSLTNVGMGNKNMQEDLIKIADAMGQFNKDTTTAANAGKSFRDSLEKKWLSADVMGNYLKIMKGDVTDAQMKSMGLTQKQIDGLMKHQEVAEEAATKVRTATQLFGTLKESVGSQWSQTFEMVLGDFDSATEFFTKINETVGGLLGQMGDRRNEILSAWAEGGGRDSMLNGIYNILEAIGQLSKILGDAWDTIFPSKGASDGLITASKAFENFTKMLIPTAAQAKVIGNIFKGVFSVIKIVWTILKALGTVAMAILKPIFQLFGSGTGIIADFAAQIGIWAEQLAKWIDESQFMEKVGEVALKVGQIIAKFIGGAIQVLGVFFGMLAIGAQVAWKWLQKVGEGFRIFFGALSGNSELGEFEGLMGRLNDIGFEIGVRLRSVKVTFDKFLLWFTGFKTAFTNQMLKLAKGFTLMKTDEAGNQVNKLQEAGEKLAETGKKMAEGWQNVKDFFSGIWKVIGGVGTAIGDAIKFIFDNVKRAISGTDPNVALGTLNLGLVLAAVLSFKSMLKSLGFNEIANAIKGVADTFSSMSGTLKSMSFENYADGLKSLAIAVLVIAAALWVLAQIPQDRLLTAGTAILTLTGALVASMKLMSGFTSAQVNPVKLTTTAAAMVVLATAVLLMAFAAEKMAGVDYNALAKTTIALGALVGAMILLDKVKINDVKIMQMAISMRIIATAMLLMTAAVLLMSLMEWGTFIDGMGRIAIALGILAAVFWAFPEKEVIKSSAAIAIIAAALMLLIAPIKMFAALDPDVFFEGMIRITAALVILAGVMRLMKNEVKGAVALILIIASLVALGEALKFIGELPLSTIGTAVVTIAVILGILTAVAFAITASGLVAALYAVALAVAAFGAAVFLIGAGLKLGVEAFKLFIEIFSQGPALILKALSTFMMLIPAITAAIIGFLIGLLGALASNLDAMLKIIISIVMSVLNSLRVLIPEVVKFVIDLLDDLVKQILDYLTVLATDVGEAATQIIANFVQGIADNIGDVVDAAVDLIVNFLDGLADGIPRIANSATDLIVAFINAIEDEMPRIVQAAVDLLTTFLDELGNHLTDIGDAATELITTLMKETGKNTAEIITTAGDVALKFLTELNKWFDTNKAEMDRQLQDIMMNIAEGLSRAAAGSPLSIIKGIGKGIGGALVSGIEGVLQIHSPSKVFKRIGGDVMKGFAIGLKSGSATVVQEAWNDMRSDLKSAMSDIDKQIKDHKDKLKQLKENPGKNAAAIKKEQKLIAQLTSERNKLSKTYKNMDKYLKDERDQIKKLAKEYEKVVVQLEAAQEVLSDLKQEREDYNNEIADQHDDFVTVDSEDSSLAKFLDDTRKKLDETQALREKLAAVADLGLNDKLYQQLVEQGVEAIPFLDEIISGGASAIEELNRLDKDLDTISSGLGSDASSKLHDAGVNMAQGIVDGLVSKEAELKGAMEKLADYMVKAIKKNLGIKSPSRVFAEIGKYATDGLVEGLKKHAPVVEKAADELGGRATSAMENALKYLGEIVPDEMNLEPTITPVLDLTQITSQSGAINSLLAARQLAVSASATNAAAAAAGIEDNVAAADMMAMEARGNTTFNQINQSPKALNDSEIYRQTTNLLSKAKGELTT